MSINTAVATTLDEVLGGISVDRVRTTPPLGKATFADCISVNESSNQGLCELVDGTLVGKASSDRASVIASAVLRNISTFVTQNHLGIVSGANGFFQLSLSTRAPCVAFLSRDRLPDGKFPTQPYPTLAPNLVVEVLSPGNTRPEMARKRLEYFHNGVELVWIVDCVHRSVAVYQSTTDLTSDVRIVGEEETIDGGSVLPGFTALVGDFFTDLDIGQPTL